MQGLPSGTSVAPNVLPRLIEIPRGEFWMGQEDGRDEEKPVHRVRVGDFGLGVFQVTNEQYAAFRRDTGHRCPTFQDDAFNHPRQPVVGVSWFDATAYCDWLSENRGGKFRLPTEAEWEWAARGGLVGKRFPWGDEPPTSREDYERRWLRAPEIVGASAPNGFGLHDMCENVHEWCSDWYDPAFYAVSPVDDPKGPEKGTRRSSRGGAWRHHIKIARCAARSSIPPQFEYADYGFRVACDL